MTFFFCLFQLDFDFICWFISLLKRFYFVTNTKTRANSSVMSVENSDIFKIGQFISTLRLQLVKFEMSIPFYSKRFCLLLSMTWDIQPINRLLSNTHSRAHIVHSMRNTTIWKIWEIFFVNATENWLWRMREFERKKHMGRQVKLEEQLCVFKS